MRCDLAQVLKLGYDVFFIDPDVALIRDPLKYMLFKNVDYVHSVNLRCNRSAKPVESRLYDCLYDFYLNFRSEPAWDFYKTEQEGNTGFYLLRSNSRSITLMEMVIRKAPT